MTALIEVRGVVNRFGDQIVHDGVDLTLQKGQILGLVGGSGSGKSVLLRTILGLHKPEKGTVTVDGRDVMNLNEQKKTELARKWGVLFQNGALFSNLNVLDNVGLPLREYTDMSEKDIESLAAFKLNMAGLQNDVAEKSPSALSGGMARRAALARALALDPDILFLDEPTSGLDPVSAAAFDELILKLHRILKLSVLIITHDLDTLITVCDRIVMLVDKKAITGTVKDMMRSDNAEIHAFFCGPRMRNIPQHSRAANGK